MDTSHRRSLRRGLSAMPAHARQAGASLLAGVVFVAILGVVGLAVQSTQPVGVPSSQIAGAGCLPGIQEVNGECMQAVQLPPVVTTVVGAGAQPTIVSDTPEPGEAECYNGRVFTKAPVNYACRQEALGSKVDEILQTCRPGFKYTITENKGTIKVEPTSMEPSRSSCNEGAPPTCLSSKKSAIQSFSNEKCHVIYCVEVGVENFPGSSILKSGCFEPKAPAGAADMRTNAIKDLAGKLGADEASRVVPDLLKGLPQANQDAILNAFTKPVEEQITGIKAQRDDIAKQIAALGDCKTHRCAEDASMLKLNDTQLEARQKAFKDQLDTLAKNATKLAACGSQVCRDAITEKDSPLDNRFRPATCPSGTTGTPPNCRASCSGSDCFPPGPGGGKPQPDGGSSALSSLLSSLMKALGGGGGSGSGGAPSQACSLDSAVYQQQQQQYQQQLQQYQIALQQYNYQLQLNAAYGNSNSAPQPPVAPKPCTPYDPSSNTPPTAQISCQPQVGDPGMTLAISYSCSTGTATGSGFTATGQPSGSATATIGTPPAGTNTATYGLLCTNKSLSASAHCTVQISRPSIILVANPKTVTSGDISLLGWITSGMQSCVISSPQQADFTARNASSTSPNGTATTSPLTAQSTFALRCETLAGGTKDASTTIDVVSP